MLAEAEVACAVAQEVAMFTEIFQLPPTVVVPPTFVWSPAVEAAWVAHGIRIIVTPGRRYVGRDADGSLVPESQDCYNGETGASGAMYIVRNAYFEPALGHRAEDALDALQRRTRAGRPTLLETHRFNFIDETSHARKSRAELGRLLVMVLDTFPEVVFMSTEELVAAIRDRDPLLIETRTGARFRAWLNRLAELPRFKKIAWSTGLIAPWWLLYWIAGRSRHAARRANLGERMGR